MYNFWSRYGFSILGVDSTQGLDVATLTAEKIYSINVTENNKKLLNGKGKLLNVNGKEIIKFKAKDSEIVATLLCLRNISKDFSVDHM